MSEDLMALGRRTAQHQDEMANCSDTLEQVARRLATDETDVSRDNRAIRESRSRWVWAGGLAAAVAAAALLAWPGTEPAPLTYVVDGNAHRVASSDYLTASFELVNLRFSDGSVVTLGRGATARVARLDTRGAALALQTGQVQLDVEHTSSDTSWQLTAGPYRVHVVGTRFVVDWDAATTELFVSVREGKVRVEGPALSERVMAAGETLRVRPPQPRAPQPAAEPQAPQPAPTESAAEDQTPPQAASRRTRSPRSKQPTSDSAGALLARARKLSPKDPAGAQDLLQHLREHYPNSPQAPDAAFMLARLQPDPARALKLLETYRREQPRGRFAEAALGRTMRARIALGQSERAREDARAYLNAYPDGPYAAEAKRVLAQ